MTKTSKDPRRPPQLELLIAPKAKKDLGRLTASTLARVQAALRQLAVGAPNLDIKPLKGLPPWWRLRIGSHRVLYRSLTKQELKEAKSSKSKGIFIARCVPRKELEAESKNFPNSV